MRDNGPRGGQWLSKGEEIVVDSIDRKQSPLSDEDWCSRQGATRLGAIIVEYWRNHGSTNVSVKIVSPKDLGFVTVEENVVRIGSIWGIRSNLVNGVPKKTV